MLSCPTCRSVQKTLFLQTDPYPALHVTEDKDVAEEGLGKLKLKSKQLYSVGGLQCSAKDCCINALELEPENAERWFKLGIQGGTVGVVREYSEKDCYMRAVELDPHLAMAWYKLGTQGGGTVAGFHYSAEDCFLKSGYLAELEPKSWGAA